MTTIVAVRKNGRICIVSDSLITYGGRRKEGYGKLLAPTSKLIFHNNMIIGYSGSSAWDHCVEELFVSSGSTIGFRSPEELKEKLLSAWELLRNKYQIVPIPDERFTSFSKCQIVIACHDRLFELTIEGCVIENKNIVAIGNGRPFSYGAVKALDPFVQDPCELAMAGVRAAAAWDPNTSGPFSGWKISETGKCSTFFIDK